MIQNEPVLLSIVIVNFNGERFLSACFDSIRSITTCPFEIILIDNASSDNSIELIRNDYPDIHLLQSEQNLGFAAGNNIGVMAARGRYILLLNNDTILLSDPKIGCEILNIQAEIGALGARMLDEGHRETASCGYFPAPHRLVFYSSMLFMPANDERVLVPVDWVQGSFLLMRRNDYIEIGGMDEKYFMYWEDVDLCRRIVANKFKVIFCKKLSYLHFGGYNPYRWIQIYRGFKRYHQKFSSCPVRLLAYLILNLGLFSRLLVYQILILFKPNSKEIRQFLDGVYHG